MMILSCLGYRYADRVADVMDQRTRFKYDLFVLAGALGGNAGEGVANTVPPAWRQALVSHIRAARAIRHPVKNLVTREHRQCGAYYH